MIIGVCRVFGEGDGDHRDLHYPLRRQRQMCIRDRNRPGQKFYKVLAESALRAVRLCQPLKVPPTGYEKWKDIQLNFNPTEMLKG